MRIRIKMYPDVISLLVSLKITTQTRDAATWLKAASGQANEEQKLAGVITYALWNIWKGRNRRMFQGAE
jgi:hypothetical protein